MPTNKLSGTVGMGIDMEDPDNMSVCVMQYGQIVHISSHSDYDTFNETVQRLQAQYGIPNNKIMYENNRR